MEGVRVLALCQARRRDHSADQAPSCVRARGDLQVQSAVAAPTRHSPAARGPRRQSLRRVRSPRDAPELRPGVRDARHAFGSAAAGARGRARGRQEERHGDSRDASSGAGARQQVPQEGERRVRAEARSVEGSQVRHVRLDPRDVREPERSNRGALHRELRSLLLQTRPVPGDAFGPAALPPGKESRRVPFPLRRVGLPVCRALAQSALVPKRRLRFGGRRPR